MVEKEKRSGKTAVIIISIVCVTLVLFAGIGAYVYVNQQNLRQAKELKKEEIKAENERAQKKREVDDRNSQRDCYAQSTGFSSMGCR